MRFLEVCCNYAFRLGQGPITKSEQLLYQDHIYFQTHFTAIFPRKQNLHHVYEGVRSIRYQKGKINVIKRQKISLLGLQVLMTGLWNLKDIQNQRQNRSKNKLVRKNAVTRAHGSFIIYLFILFFLFSIAKYLAGHNTYLQTMYGTYATNKTILYLQNNTYLQCEILTLLTILYSTYNTKLAILTYNEILTLLTVLYSALYIYTKKKKTPLLALLTLRITYATKTRK